MTRIRSIRAAANTIAFVVLAACGTAEDLPDELTYPEESDCLNCGMKNEEARQQIVPTPHVFVSPTQLMFYPTSMESKEFGPKRVTVMNATKSWVVVTQSYVGNDPWAWDDPDGDDYFETPPFTDKVPLAPEESTDIFVSFVGSARQRSAYLHINTTDPEFATLSVALTGKFFLSEGN